MKQTLQQLGGTIGKAFVNMLKPAVQSLTRFFNTLIGLVEKAINAIGKLLGWQVRIDPVGAQFEDDAEGASDALDGAAGGAGGVADGLEDAADAAKKLNKQLMAYDEINNIKLPDEDESGSGGSGGGGGGGGGGGASGGGGGAGGATGGGVRYEKYQSDISSWWELGRKIGETLTKSMEEIDWDSIYRKAELFGRGLADFLNGLISPELFSALGRTIAGALNTALTFLNTFGTTFNWAGFGTSLATGLNRFLNEFNFAMLGQAMTNWANGLLTALISFLKKVDWKLLGTKIGEFLKNLDFVTIAGEVVQALYLAINGAFTTWAGALNVAPVETALATIGGAALLLKFTPVKRITGWFTSAKDAAKTFFDMIVISAQDSGKNFAKFGENLDTLGASMTPLETAILGISAGVLEFFAVKDGVSDIIDALVSNEGAWTDHWETYAGAIGEITAAVGFAELAFIAVFGVPAGTAVTAVGAFIGLIAGISEEINKIETESFHQKLQAAFVNDEGVPFNDVIDAINQSIIDMGAEITNTSQRYDEFSTAKDTIEDLNTQINEMTTAVETGYSSAEEYIPQIMSLYEQLADAIETKYSVATATLVTALGDGGIISRSYESLGNDINATVKELQANETEATDRAHELATTINDLYAQKLEAPELWTEAQQTELSNAVLEMSRLSGETSALSQSLGELQSTAAVSGLNISKYFDENGEFLESDFGEAMSSIVTSGKKVQDTLITTSNELADMAEGVGNIDLANAFRGDLLVESLSNLGAEVGEKVVPTMDILQEQLVDRGGQIISDAVAEWDKMPKAQQKLLGYENAGNYAESQYNRYKAEVVDPIAGQIQSAYEELGIEGKAWASDAMDEIKSGIWEKTEYYDDEGFRNELFDSQTLVDNFEQVYQELADAKFDEKMSDVTKDMIAGGVSGVEEDKGELVDAFTGTYDDVEEGVRDTTKTHSPSEVYKGISIDMVDGAILGIRNKKEEFINSVRKMAEEAADGFKKALQDGVNNAVKSLSVPKVSTSGSNSMSGMMQGQMTAASTTVDTSMQEMFTDVLPQYFETTQWDGLFTTLQGTLSTGMESITSWFDGEMSDFFDNGVKPWFQQEKLSAAIYDPLSESNETAFGEFESWFDKSMTTWWEEDLDKWFAQDKWMAEFEPIHTSAEETFEKIRKTIKRLMKEIGEDVHASADAIGKELDGVSRTLKDTGKLTNISVSVGTNGTTAYATGGFVEDGLFFANHNEMVGRFSNGRTAVANNAQIVAGIQAGVYLAVRDAMNDSDGPNVQIVGDTDRIFRVMQSKSRQFKRSTGSPAFG